MTELLPGPCGDNLLGYLTALGTLRTLHRAWPTRSVRLGWQVEAGGWQPVIVAEGDVDQGSILRAISEQLRGTSTSPEFTALGGDLPVPAEDYQRVAVEARASCWADRRTVDFLAAFGHDAVPRDEVIHDTAFRTMSGAGHQHFLLFMQQLAADTTTEHLRTALFEVWRYRDPRPSMRWDPLDDRRYALRSFDPGNTSRSPILTVRGANRLAIEALPAFPVVPTGGRDRTRGFQRLESATLFTWPIWQIPLGWDAVKTLLGHPELVERLPRRNALRDVGVVEVFRCRRINVDRFRNFTPAVACWGAASQ